MYKKNYRIFNKVYDQYLPVCRRNDPGEMTARADDVYTDDSIHGVCFPILNPYDRHLHPTSREK